MMACERLGLGLTAKPQPHAQVAAIIAPVAVAHVVTPPCIAPLAADAELAAEVYVRAKGRNKGCVIQHIGSQSYIKRLAAANGHRVDRDIFCKYFGRHCVGGCHAYRIRCGHFGHSITRPGRYRPAIDSYRRAAQMSEITDHASAPGSRSPGISRGNSAVIYSNAAGGHGVEPGKISAHIILESPTTLPREPTVESLGAFGRSVALVMNCGYGQCAVSGYFGRNVPQGVK